MNRLFCTTLAALALFGAVSAHAGLVGQQVTGTLQFGGGGTNFFNPANGLVPAGYGNSASHVGVVIGAGVEFGFDDSFNRDLADFTDTQLIITGGVSGFQSNYPFAMTFTSLTAGLFDSIVAVSDTFTNGGLTASLVGNTITINWAGGPVQPGALRAVFDIGTTTSNVPEPGSLALAGLALLGASAARRRFTR